MLDKNIWMHFSFSNNVSERPAKICTRVTSKWVNVEKWKKWWWWERRWWTIHLSTPGTHQTDLMDTSLRKTFSQVNKEEKNAKELKRVLPKRLDELKSSMPSFSLSENWALIRCLSLTLFFHKLAKMLWISTKAQSCYHIVVYLWSRNDVAYSSWCCCFGCFTVTPTVCTQLCEAPRLPVLQTWKAGVWQLMGLTLQRAPGSSLL